MESNRKTAREILSEMRVDPVRSLGEIAQTGSVDTEVIDEAIESCENELIRAEMMKVKNDAKKIQITVLKELSSICQKEDDQSIKLMDHGLRQEEFAWKRENVGKNVDANQQIVYSTPNYRREIGEDGKVKLIREEVNLNIEAE